VARVDAGTTGGRFPRSRILLSLLLALPVVNPLIALMSALIAGPDQADARSTAAVSRTVSTKAPPEPGKGPLTWARSEGLEPPTF